MFNHEGGRGLASSKSHKAGRRERNALPSYEIINSNQLVVLALVKEQGLRPAWFDFCQGVERNFVLGQVMIGLKWPRRAMN